MAGEDPHTVPRFFLNRFAKRIDNKNKVIEVLRDGSRAPRPISTKGATVKTHFYSVPGPDGKLDTKFDDALTILESRAAQALVRLTDHNGFPPTQADREMLAKFFAAQSIRGQLPRAALNEIAERIAAAIAEGPPADQVRAE